MTSNPNLQTARWYESCHSAGVIHPAHGAVLALCWACALPACGPTHQGGADAPDASGGGPPVEAGADSGTGVVEIGKPGGSDGLEFTPMQDGDELRLETFGQGGFHVLLGVRAIGFGSRAFVSITLTNSVTGTQLIAPAPARPQLLFCEADVCDLVPITVMAGGLTQTDAERSGLAIQVDAQVHNVAGVSGSDSKSAVLSTADL